jgi:hypothetical protein
MVPWWKRLILSLVSVIAADVVCCAGLIIASELDWKTLAHLFDWLIFATPFAFISSFPGWLLSIPIILFIQRVNGGRFWLLWGAGTLIGPVVFFGSVLISFLGNAKATDLSTWNKGTLLLVVAVSCTTTLIYLMLLRNAQIKAASGQVAEV